MIPLNIDNIYNYKVIITGYSSDNASVPAYCQEHYCISKDAALAMYKDSVRFVRMAEFDDFYSLGTDNLGLKTASIHVIRMTDNEVLRWCEYADGSCTSHANVAFPRW